MLSQGLPFVEASINGKPIDALLDLGAGENIANWASVSVIEINVNRALRGRFAFTGAFGDIPVDAFMRPVDVGIGERIWNGQEVGVTNLRVFETMERLEVPTLIISAGLLRDEDIILDFPAGKMFLHANLDQRTPTRRNCRILDIDGFEGQCF